MVDLANLKIKINRWNKERITMLIVGWVTLIDWFSDLKKLDQLNIYDVLLTLVPAKIFLGLMVLTKLLFVYSLFRHHCTLERVSISALSALWALVAFSALSAFLFQNETITPTLHFTVIAVGQYYAFTRPNCVAIGGPCGR